MDPCRTVGENVVRLRERMGISQTKLAARLGPYKLGVTQGYISELEAGQKNPTLTTLAALAEALEVELAELVSSHVAAQ